MNILNLKHVTYFFIFGMTLYVSSAQAYTCKTETTSTTITIPDMSVPRDAAVGTKIGSVKTGEISAFNCTNEAPAMTYQEVGAKGLGTRSATKISGANIYLLGDSGVGYSIGVAALGCSTSVYYINGSGTGDGNLNNRLVCSYGVMFPTQPMKVEITLNFFKMGNLKPGKVAAKDMASVISRVNQTTWLTPESTVTGTEFTLTSQGCSVTNTSISVPMGTVNSSHFRGVGSTTGDQDFSIPLNCDTGIKVGLTVTGGSAGNFDVDKGLINLDTSTTSTVASGVKLQILSKDAPIKLNSVIGLGIREVQGVFNVPLTARYYQSASPITAGLANGTATFTMKYE